MRPWTVSHGVQALLMVLAIVGRAAAEQTEMERLQRTVDDLESTVRQMKQQIDRLEREAADRNATPAPVAVPAARPAPPSPTAGDLLAPQGVGPQGEVMESMVRERDALRNEQEAAPRVGNVPLEDEFRGFVNVPNTRALIRFNAKPRVDMTYDVRNPGDDNRFVTAKIPVEGSAAHGGGSAFNINAKGSQLSIDVRAPTVPGSPRFYYQNDFYGSGGGEFPYRLRFLYGSWYDLTIGHAFSVFEDPDVWPDTVDYEGPNAMIFARRPLVRYAIPFAADWTANVGVEQPDTLVAPYFGATLGSQNHAPDVTGNVRWESEARGHVQLATVFRDLVAQGSGVFVKRGRGATLGSQQTLGWGLSGTGAFTVFGRDTVLALATYGQGIGAYGNDTSFFANDVAFDADGDLMAIPYLGLFAGYSHTWADRWRSTVTYGFVDQDPEVSQGNGAYRRTHYGSANLIWQMRERLSVGFETLYGHNELASGRTGSDVRMQVGVVYSIF